MNNYIKTQAEHLSKTSHIDNPYNTREFKERLQKFLYQFHLPADKTDFLNYYQKLMDNVLAKHREKCKKDDCAYMTTNETVTFFVNQELALIKKEDEKERFWRFGTIIENLTITGDNQILNFGKVEGDIKHNVESLNKAGLIDISHSIEQLTAAIKETNEIDEQQKRDYFDKLKLLSEEALKPKDERLPHSILKTIIQYGLGTLNALSSISTITGVTLPFIADYFLNK